MPQITVNDKTAAGELYRFASDMKAGDKLRATYDKKSDTYTLYTSNKGSGTGLKNFLFKTVDKKQAAANDALIKILHNTPKKVMTTSMGKWKLASAMACSKVFLFMRHTGDMTKGDLEKLTAKWQTDIGRAHKQELEAQNPPPPVFYKYDPNEDPFANPGDPPPSGPPVILDFSKTVDTSQVPEQNDPPLDDLPLKYSPFKAPNDPPTPLPPPGSIGDMMLGGRIDP